VDGKHIIVAFDLNAVPQGWKCDPDDDRSFITHSTFLTLRYIKFRRYWRPDEFCQGFKTLIPAAEVFIGFGSAISATPKKED